MLLDIFAHKLAQNLRGGLVLRSASLKELFAQITLKPYA